MEANLPRKQDKAEVQRRRSACREEQEYLLMAAPTSPPPLAPVLPAHLLQCLCSLASWLVGNRGNPNKALSWPLSLCLFQPSVPAECPPLLQSLWGPVRVLLPSVFHSSKLALLYISCCMPYTEHSTFLAAVPGLMLLLGKTEASGESVSSSVCSAATAALESTWRPWL